MNKRCETVEIVADTQRYPGNRVTTFLTKIPVHTRTHILTHRVLSRNGESSRAVPLEKGDFSYTPYLFPVENNKMIPGHYYDRDSKEHEECLHFWNTARDAALELCGLRDPKMFQNETLKSLRKPHKEIANRVLDPYKMVYFLITTDDLDNFFKLRCDQAAQESVQFVAKRMKHLLDVSSPTSAYLHLPFISNTEANSDDYTLDELAMISAGRCAAISFGNTKKEVERSLRLAERLTKDGHWSPFEHQVIVTSDPFKVFGPKYQNLNGNLLPGALQHRRILQRGMSFSEVFNGFLGNGLQSC